MILGLFILLLTLSVVSAAESGDDIEELLRSQVVPPALQDQIKAQKEALTISASSTSSLTIISGNILNTSINDTGGPGIPVRVYCEHDSVWNLLGETATTNAGTYSVFTLNILPDKLCKAGDRVYIEADTSAGTHQSEIVDVELGYLYDFAVAHIIGVPEFPVWAFPAIVVIAGLGIATMRRRDSF